MNDMSKVDAGRETETVRRPARRVAMLLAVPLLVLAVGFYLWLGSGKTVETDNAYVKQDIVAISAQLSGPVAEVFVDENQRVKVGDPLYRIDQAPAEVALLQAQAQLDSARLQTDLLRTQASGTAGAIRAAEANLATARRALGRQQALMKDGFTTRARLDDAANEVAKAEGQLAEARARAANASAAIDPGGTQPQVEMAQAAIAKARLDLRHGMIVAPVAGIVAKSDRLIRGQTVIPGVAMLSIVRDTTPWVEANFKEGDLARMAPGQKAVIRFDAYPDLKLNGHIASIGAGTGSEFSVLPAQNANGNWVKVTQRVPVRIAFDQPPPRQMIAGLSARVEVFFGTQR